MEKEYMLSQEELARRFPIGSKHEINGELYVVRGHEKPMASNYMASYPTVKFDKIQN